MNFRNCALVLLMVIPTVPAKCESYSELARERMVVSYIEPSRWRASRSDVPIKDPVAALTDEELQLLADRKDKNAADKIFEGFIERALQYYSEKMKWPEDLVTFLKANKEVRETFVAALNYRYDDLKIAAEIFNEIRLLDEKLLLKYFQLATAIAVVHDNPDALTSSRYASIWGVPAEQFPETPLWKDIWAYYTSPANSRYFAFRLDQLPWPLLVHLVDNDTPPEDREWVLKKYKKQVSMDSLYAGVEYDYDKLKSKGSGKLGTNIYSLPNLRQYGGVCGDQSYFTSRVAKCLGIPSMKVSGEGRYGGIGHAWAGFLRMNRGKQILDFCGRYFFDYYYTGDIFDPQTRTFTLDRYVAMLYDGASLSYEKYNRSMVLTRIAEAVYDAHPQASLDLTAKALEANYFNLWAWPLLMQQLKDGRADKKMGVQWFNDMLKVLREHPDMTFPCLGTFLECFEDTQRQSIYEQTFKLYNDRPDLQLQLRMAQADHLISINEKIVAVNILIPTITDNSKEGTLIMPAMKKAVELAMEFGVEKKAYALLKKADLQFPKDRFGRPSEAYAEFKALLDSLNVK